MSQSLWDLSVEQLLGATASAEPTPGGGAVAAVVAGLGLGLIQMAIEVTLAAEGTSPPDSERRLRDARDRLSGLRAVAVAAADRDVSDFDAIMAAYRMPREPDAQRQLRRAAIDTATVIATQGPLDLVETATRGIALADEVGPLVRASIVSDVLAGRDILRGAALAALRTADINLSALEGSDHADAPGLRRRRDALQRTTAPPAPPTPPPTPPTPTPPTPPTPTPPTPPTPTPTPPTTPPTPAARAGDPG